MTEDKCAGCLCESCKNKNTDKCFHSYDVCRECRVVIGYYSHTVYCPKRRADNDVH